MSFRWPWVTLKGGAQGVIFFTRISLITLVPFVPTKYCRRSVFLGVSHALYRKGGAQAQPQNWVALGPAPCVVRINRRNPLRTPFGAELCTKYDTCEGLVLGVSQACTPRGSESQRSPIWCSFLFMRTPFLTKFDVVTRGEGRVSWGQPRLPESWVSALPNFVFPCIYAIHPLTQNDHSAR